MDGERCTWCNSRRTHQANEVELLDTGFMPPQFLKSPIKAEWTMVCESCGGEFLSVDYNPEPLTDDDRLI